MLVAVALVLLSAFTHAAWNALLRLETDKDRALVAAIGVATLVSVVVAIVRWTIAREVPFETPGALAWSVAAGLLEVVYFVSLARALETGSLGVVYTISRGGAVLVVWPVSLLVFAEPATLPGLVGSVIVLAGLALSSARSGDTRTTRNTALAWSIVCAVAIAGYHLAYKAALREGGTGSAVFAVGMAVATAINLVRLGSVGRTAMWHLARVRLGRVLLMGTICGGSFLLLIEALVSGGAGFVLTMRNTSVLFAIGLAFAIGERPRRPQILGAILVAAGATVMAWK